MLKQCLFSLAAAACMVAVPVATPASSTVADPSLSGWIKDVLSRNPGLEAAQAAVEAAGGRFHAADQPLFNPELEFEYESSETDTTAGGFRQTIDWADKRGARTAVAKSERMAADADLRSKRQSLATDLLRALATWHTADAVARVSEKQTTLMTRFAHIAGLRRKAGDLGQVELDLSHLAAADAAFEQAKAAENLIRARLAVSSLTGAAGPGWPEFTGQLPDIDHRRLDVDRLLNDLPSMQAAVARIAAGYASVQRSIRDTRPEPTVGFRVGKEDSATLAGVSVSIPLFVRNNHSAEVDVANADLMQAEREAANLRQQAHANIIAAAQVYRNAKLAWKAWEASGAPRLSHRTDLLDRLWQAGELDTTDYLVQLKQALDTDVSAIEQRGRLWQAWADWLAASGQTEQWLNLAGDSQ